MKEYYVDAWSWPVIYQYFDGEVFFRREDKRVRVKVGPLKYKTITEYLQIKLQPIDEKGEE